MDTFSQGYRFKNGLPCNDNLLATIAEFYEYAKAQGCTDTPQQFFDDFGTMLADAINYNYAQDTDDDSTAQIELALGE